MATFRLYRRQSDWNDREDEVGRVVDGQLEVGTFSSTEYPAHVDDQGVVVSGATFTPAFQQRSLGRVSDDGRSVVRGRDVRGEVVGTFDPDGTVYMGVGPDRRRIGRTEPASGAAAACLLLVLAADELGKRPREPAAAARVAVGIASAAAGIAVAEALRHATHPSVRPMAKTASASSATHPDAPPSRPKSTAQDRLHPDVPEYTESGPEFVDVSPENPRYDAPLHADLVHLLGRLRDWGGNVDGEYGLEDGYRRGLVTRTQLTESLWRFMCIHVAVLGGVVPLSDVPAFADSGDYPPPPYGWREGGWKLLGPPQPPQESGAA